MNQILDKYDAMFFKKLRTKKYIYIALSTILSIILVNTLGFWFYNKNLEYALEKKSKKIFQGIKLFDLYNSNIKNDTYVCTIYIDKINLEYPVFNSCSESNLKIAPCRFYGDIDNNLCIVGHNYNDSRFFSKLFDLELNDLIILKDFKREPLLIYCI